jgi:cadmium resistance protein CadD (predicted permease)
MESALALAGIAIVAFASTNIDDIVVLALFFSRRGFRPAHVVAGQYIGIGAIVAASLLLAGAVQLLSTGWVHWLGLLPLAIGLRWLLDLVRSGPVEPAVPADVGETVASRGPLLSVAAVTFANGGDNLGVYAPLFATRDAWEVSLIVVLFAVLVAVWCAGVYVLTRHPLVRERATRLGRIVAPFVLIALGLAILFEVDP